MSRQERRRKEKVFRKSSPVKPAVQIILDPNRVLASDAEELSPWKELLEGYKRLHSYSNLLAYATAGFKNRLGFSEEDTRNVLSQQRDNFQPEPTISMIQGLPRDLSVEFVRLINPIRRLFIGPRYNDDATQELLQEYSAGNIQVGDYVSLLRTYTFEMQQTMQVYVDVLTPEKSKKKREAKKISSQQPPQPVIEDDSKALPEEPTANPDITQTEDLPEGLDPSTPFFLTGKTIHYTRVPWSARPKDLIRLDTSSREVYMAQLRKLLAGHVDGKPSSIATAVEIAFMPDAYAHLKKAGLRYIPEGVDERWLRIKRGSDRIGFLPLQEEDNVPIEAIVFAGHRAWVYDRVSR